MANLEAGVFGGLIKALFRRNGEIVGSAWGGLEGDVAQLDTVQVNPPERGMGVGKQVVSAFVDAARQSGAKRIKGEVKPEFGLRVQETRRFYSSLGFEVGDDSSLNMDL